jgi:two-component system phosphate regulon response regulator PhoB
MPLWISSSSPVTLRGWEIMPLTSLKMSSSSHPEKTFATITENKVQNGEKSIPKEKILVVEDESEIRQLIELQLSREGYVVDTVETGEAAIEKIKSKNYQLLVLDWMLTGMSGIEIARIARGECAILMVTARSEPADIVLGLEAGADDYVTKPFDVSVLRARVRALLRRRHSTKDLMNSNFKSPIQVGGLKLDLKSYEVKCEGLPIQLTHSEFKLLSTLVLHRGTVLTRERLIQEIQGEGVSVIDRTVDTHVFGLRKKLGACADVIETIRGVGYRIVISESTR